MGEDSSSNKRRHQRVRLSNSQPIHVELGGETQTLVLLDVSETGLGLIVPRGAPINPDDVMDMGAEQVITMRGRVRWVKPHDAEEGEMALGVEFEAITVQPRAGDETQDMAEAWMRLSHSYNIFDGFLQTMDRIDNDVLDGRVGDSLGAVTQAIDWIEDQLGPLNLWRAEPGGQPARLLVGHRELTEAERQVGVERVAATAAKQATEWFDGRPYLFGDSLVVECLGGFEGRLDLLHKIAGTLGRRYRIWKKLLAEDDLK